MKYINRVSCTVFTYVKLGHAPLAEACAFPGCWLLSLSPRPALGESGASATAFGLEAAALEAGAVCGTYIASFRRYSQAGHPRGCSAADLLLAPCIRLRTGKRAQFASFVMALRRKRWFCLRHFKEQCCATVIHLILLQFRTSIPDVHTARVRHVRFETGSQSLER